MANVRNYEEYRAEVLDRLGDDYTVEDLRNTERWRLHVLDMLSGGGSGGGSSDFSTAQVTVINNSSSELSSTNLIVIYPDDEFLSNGFATDPNSQNIYNILLYKGQAEIYDLKKNGNPMTDGTGITVSGNIENRSDETEVYMLITGDCTITIS